jgi:hypothetical protein
LRLFDASTVDSFTAYAFIGFSSCASLLPLGLSYLPPPPLVLLDLLFSLSASTSAEFFCTIDS